MHATDEIKIWPREVTGAAVFIISPRALSVSSDSTWPSEPEACRHLRNDAATEMDLPCTSVPLR